MRDYIKREDRLSKKKTLNFTVIIILIAMLGILIIQALILSSLNIKNKMIVCSLLNENHEQVLDCYHDN